MIALFLLPTHHRVISWTTELDIRDYIVFEGARRDIGIVIEHIGIDPTYLAHAWVTIPSILYTSSHVIPVRGALSAYAGRDSLGIND